MKNIPLICAVLMAMAFATGESLTCNTCKVDIAGKCFFSSNEVCSDNQPSCYWGKLAFNVSRSMTLKTRGCLDSSLCNKTQTGTLLTAGYTVTRTCCPTDLCNGATSVQLPLTAALGAAVIASWSPWAL